ncbi:MAG: hypothetical protein Q4P71_09225 [Actinomycetaceae bacterium]|nr:hypothetical protein [Actinomycetaceae bacterium]
MSPHWINVTVILPLMYLLAPVLFLFAIMDNSPDYIGYSAIAVLATIPVLTVVSWIALTVNRAPILIQIAQGVLAILGIFGVPGFAGISLPFDISLFDYASKMLFLVAFGSPVVSFIGYRAVTHARRSKPPAPGKPIEYPER